MATKITFNTLTGLAVGLIWLTSSAAFAQDVALSLYAGQLTKEKWEQALSPKAEMADATLFVASAAWTVGRYFDARLSVELEAQVGKYVGDQTHWELNLPILGFRWHRFPWDHHMATSVAWGIGPSYATRIPEVELETNDESSRWLIYWFGEVTVGPPAAHWEILFRLHHRSDGFGTVAEDGGSNALCAGLRYRF